MRNFIMYTIKKNKDIDEDVMICKVTNNRWQARCFEAPDGWLPVGEGPRNVAIGYGLVQGVLSSKRVASLHRQRRFTVAGVL